jgi:hypothetical protein
MSLRTMRHIFMSYIPEAWICLRTDLLGLWSTDANIQKIFSCVRNEQGRPGGFLQVTEHSSLLSVTIGDGASRWLNSRRNPFCHAVMDPSRNDKLCSRIRSYTFQNSPPTVLQRHCCRTVAVLCHALTEILVKFFTAAPCILSCVWVTIDGVWSGEKIYWPLTGLTTNNYYTIADFHTTNQSTLSLLSLFSLVFTW